MTLFLSPVIVRERVIHRKKKGNYAKVKLLLGVGRGGHPDGHHQHNNNYREVMIMTMHVLL